MATAPSTTAPKISRAGYAAFSKPVTVTKLVNDPSLYDGVAVNLSAEIVNFLQDDADQTTAMNVSDPDDPTSIMYIQLSGSADVSKMNKTDLLTIWGKGAGSARGKNAFGATINESVVNEAYLTDRTTGYQDQG
jgi:hypothetical protein